MQYSPGNNIPYVSVVDAGTIDLLRSFGYEIVSSADLVQSFEAILDDKGYLSHVRASKKVQRVKDEAFARIADAIKRKKRLTEYEVQQFICRRFSQEGLVYDDPPIVGVNDHPADPHFEPTKKNARVFKKGDKVLIDLWAKEKKAKSVYYDITWVGYIGQQPPAKYQEIFYAVRDARDAAVQFIRDRYARRERLYGWEVDDVCRSVVIQRGYGDFFVHRTGHSIGEEVHGNGVNIDNFETKDERELVPGICFSVEPGIYLPGEMAVRSEINVFIKSDGTIAVSGAEQRELILM
jgi:Xaa-Pro dipeptidase